MRELKERVFIPGERSSPRKRKGRGSGEEKRVEPDVAEEKEDHDESNIVLEDEIFAKVRCSDRQRKLGSRCFGHYAG
jgi:hypothetical protein